MLRIAVHYDVHVHLHITDNEKLEMVLRPYTTDEFFTSEQVRCIMGKFKDPHARVCVQFMHASTRTNLHDFCISFLDPFSALSLLGAVQLFHCFSFPHGMILIDVFKRLGGSRCHVSSTGDRSREFFEDDHGRAAYHWQRRGSHGIRRSCVQYVSGTLFVTLTYARDKR